MNAFPWSEAMRFGFGVLRLSSKEFWGLTPRELAAAFEAQAARARGVAPGREVLGRLMAAFPDEVR
ncbi:rcc01693 family protein [Devosia sp. CN2-171]|uniref:rcc01693 family protein n=1 Tax=Devosia sp. CN2-171 TaxID=3400909 RepID=UPI003BF7DAE1